MSGRIFRSMMKSLYVAALAVPVLLTACAGTIEPGPMPTGYKYHNTTYKSPDGAEAGFWERKGREPAETREMAPAKSMSNDDHGTVEGHMMAAPAEAQAWLPASRELVARIKSRLGQPMEPTFFEGMNGQYISGFESALKMATAEQGWPEATSKGKGPFHLSYSAIASDTANPGRMLLTARLTVSSGNFVIEESGVYDIMTTAAAVSTDAPVSLTPVQ